MQTEKSFEEIEMIVKNLGFRILSMYKQKYKKRIIIEDSDGYKIDVDLFSFMNRRSCIFHHGNVYTLENISLWLKLNSKCFELSEQNKEYLSNQKKLSFHCLSCGEFFDMDWDHVKRGQNCPFCSCRKIGLKNNFAYLYPEKVLEFIDFCDNYKNLSINDVAKKSSKQAFWKCSICNYIYKTSFNNKAKGRGCPACSGNIVSDKNRLSIKFPELLDEWDHTKNNDLTPNNVSFGSNKDVWWICKKCGYNFQMPIKWRTRKNPNKRSGCQKCAASKGEILIYEMLINKDIGFESEKIFKDCPRMPNIKRPLPLRFDFYLINYNLIIEFQGEQHYFPVDFAGKGIEWAKSEFENNKIRDRIKRDYCFNKKINYLSISYLDFENIEKIIFNKLKFIEKERED